MALKINFVGAFNGKGTKMGIRIPLTSDLNLDLELTHNNFWMQKNKEIHYSVCLKGGIV